MGASFRCSKPRGHGHRQAVRLDAGAGFVEQNFASSSTRSGIRSQSGRLLGAGASAQVHSLHSSADSGTSGILLLAKNRGVLRAYSDLFETRRVKRNRPGRGARRAAGFCLELRLALVARGQEEGADESGCAARQAGANSLSLVAIRQSYSGRSGAPHYRTHPPNPGPPGRGRPSDRWRRAVRGMSPSSRPG